MQNCVFLSQSAEGGPHAKGASMTFAGETGLGELSASGGCTSLILCVRL